MDLGGVSGNLALNTASGDVRVREARGRAALNSASGDVRVGEALGVLAVSIQSGDLDVDIDTISGEIRSDFPPEERDGATARLRVKTVSGDITLARADGR